jgi:hypothetical protein
LFIAKDLGPLGKGEIGGESDAGSLVAVAKELEKQFSGLFREGQIAQIIHQDQIKQAISSTEGFALVLSGLKALLEHNVILHLVADRFPKGLEKR